MIYVDSLFMCYEHYMLIIILCNIMTDLFINYFISELLAVNLLLIPLTVRETILVMKIYNFKVHKGAHLCLTDFSQISFQDDACACHALEKLV